MNDDMKKSAEDRKTRKGGILTRVREKTLALATYFATSHGVWGYAAPVTIPACIAGLAAVRLLGEASVDWLLLPMFAVIMAETLVETRRSREEWGEAVMRTVAVTAGFLVLARLLFLDQPAVYLTIIQAASAVTLAVMGLWVFSRIMVIFIYLFREFFFSVDDDSVNHGLGVVFTFHVPAVWILYPAACGRFWVALASAAVFLLVYLLIFLFGLRKQEYSVQPSGKAVNINDRQQS